MKKVCILSETSWDELKNQKNENILIKQNLLDLSLSNFLQLKSHRVKSVRVIFNISSKLYTGWTIIKTSTSYYKF